MDAHHLGDLVADGEHRIERGHRLLKHHGHARAADIAHGFFADLRQVLAVEQDFAACLDAPRRPNETEQGQRGHGLSAAGFADEPDRFSGVDLEADAVHRSGDAILGVEVRAEVAYA